MRTRVVLLAAIAAMALAYLLRTSGGSSDSSERAMSRPLEFEFRAPSTPATPAVAPPSRNVFQYLDAAPPAAPAAAAKPAPPPVTSAPSPSAPAVRLVGLLSRGGHLQAALTIMGETVVLGPGESADGYTVLRIDEDEGVRLQGPDGAMLLLTPSPD